MERQPQPQFRPQPTTCDTCEVQIEGVAEGVAEIVQEHDNNMNLNLLKKPYKSMKGDYSGYRSSPAPAWWRNENDFLKQKSPLGNTVLHIAASRGIDSGVDEAVQNAPNLLTAKNSNGDIALHVAAKAGYTSTVERLLAAHLRHLPLPYYADPKAALDEILVKNKRGNTFFHEALINRHKDVMNFLVFDKPEQFEAGFKVLIERAALFLTNNENESVFYLAIKAGCGDFVSQALDKLKNIDPTLDELIKSHQELDQLIPRGPLSAGKSPLLAAILAPDPDILRMILTKMPEWIHLRDKEGRTPLHYAASKGHFQGVQYLLKKCTSCAFEKDKYGYLPLHLSSYEGHVEIVKSLLEYCPYPSETLDNSGRNILHLAAECGKFEVVSYILATAFHDDELKKMINAKDADGNTPLHFATLGCHPIIVLALTRDKRVELNEVNVKNQTALDFFREIPQENMSLKQRVARMALKFAGVKYGKPQTSDSIDVPTRCMEVFWKQKVSSMDRYKERINTLMLVSTLIITVSFAAGFTMPGGVNSNDSNDTEPGQNNTEQGVGKAVMLHHRWFQLFILCITTSQYGAILATLTLISAQVGDTVWANFALQFAASCLGYAILTLSLSFLAGVHLVISDLSWLASISLAIGVFFMLLIVPLAAAIQLGFSLYISPSRDLVRVIYKPLIFLALLVEKLQAYA